MQWKKAKFPGVRYREHETRKHGLKPDKYFSVRYKLNGKDKEEGLGWASGGWTEQKANEALADIKSRIRKGDETRTLAEQREKAEAKRAADAEAKRQKEKSNTTFADVWPLYLDLAKTTKTARSVTTEKIAIQKWAMPTIGKKRLVDICALDLERIKKKMLDAGRAPRTIEYLFAMIRQVFNYAADHGLYNGENPTAKVKRLKYDNKRLRFLSREEAERLLSLLKSRNPDLHDMALLSLHTGARAGEVFSLEWPDVDMDAGQIVFRDTKNKDSRHVYMSEAVRGMLEDRQQKADMDKTPYIFPGKKGQKVKDISRTFERIISESGLNDGITDRRQKFTFHNLRHSAASWLVQAGTPLYTVQKLLGHKTAALTERYSHLAPANLQAVTAVFDEASKQGAEVIPMNGKR